MKKIHVSLIVKAAKIDFQGCKIKGFSIKQLDANFENILHFFFETMSKS